MPRVLAVTAPKPDPLPVEPMSEEAVRDALDLGALNAAALDARLQGRTGEREDRAVEEYHRARRTAPSGADDVVRLPRKVLREALVDAYGQGWADNDRCPSVAEECADRIMRGIPDAPTDTEREVDAAMRENPDRDRQLVEHDVAMAARDREVFVRALRWAAERFDGTATRWNDAADQAPLRDSELIATRVARSEEACDARDFCRNAALAIESGKESVPR